MFEENEGFNIIMNDDRSNEGVTKQNCRFWSSEKSFKLHQRSLHSLQVTVNIDECGIFL